MRDFYTIVVNLALVYIYFIWGAIVYIAKHYKDKVTYEFEIILYSFLGSFIAGCLFYYLVEKPLMKLANKLIS
jgi:peptidoglycan/LPS O-acetylase OafA/YrhL